MQKKKQQGGAERLAKGAIMLGIKDNRQQVINNRDCVDRTDRWADKERVGRCWYEYVAQDSYLRSWKRETGKRRSTRVLATDGMQPSYLLDVPTHMLDGGPQAGDRQGAVGALAGCAVASAMTVETPLQPTPSERRPLSLPVGICDAGRCLRNRIDAQPSGASFLPWPTLSSGVLSAWQSPAAWKPHDFHCARQDSQ